ncbi:MAG TPA: LemA family protein [Syntrophomonadaceae bacterium]|nr:LemA family protein [Syntrophomonadaceae bacterium]
MKKTWIIVLAVVLLFVFWGVGSYNGLVSLNESVNSKWSQIDNQLQRRADLIPNLVATVKGFASQEKGILDNIADARSRLVGAQGVADKAAANDQLSSTLSRLLVVVENYPTLKSDANFRQLQDELAGTENRLAVARKDYNDSVQVYNAKIKTFPTSIWAGMLGFQTREYFQVDEKAKSVPQVDFK